MLLRYCLYPDIDHGLDRASAFDGPIDFHIDAADMLGRVQISILLADDAVGERAGIIHFNEYLGLWLLEPGAVYDSATHSMVADVDDLSIFDSITEAASWTNRSGAAHRPSRFRL